MTDPADWKPLTPAFTAALRKYDQAARARLLRAQRRDAITAPLYHYTDRGGLAGIITAQMVWFTHYQHLNDDREIKFGMSVASSVLSEIGDRLPKARIFCDLVADLFSAENLSIVFDFYIASFSRRRDDPYQWKNYACVGEGFAIGLAPQLFGIEADRPNRKAHENIFVSPVRYGTPAGSDLQRPAIESAARIVAETAEHKATAMQDIKRGMPFFREMADRLLAVELILHCLTVKGLDWSPENEVRLFILGQRESLAPFVSTRSRGMETVPFIKSDMRLHEPGSITEILVGPAAPRDAEDFACSLLAPFHSNPRSIVHRSTASIAGF
jgi:hypothetical protein